VPTEKPSGNVVPIHRDKREVDPKGNQNARRGRNGRLPNYKAPSKLGMPVMDQKREKKGNVLVAARCNALKNFKKNHKPQKKIHKSRKCVQKKVSVKREESGARASHRIKSAMHGINTYLDKKRRQAP